MKRSLVFITIVSAVIFSISLSSCVGIRGNFPSIAPSPTVTGSPNLATWEYNFTNFTNVNVSSAFSTNITQSDSYSVTVTANDNLADYLNVYQKGDTVYIGLKLASYSDVHTEAKITMPIITSLELSGASKGNISGFSSSNTLNLELSGASVLSGEIENGDGDCNIHISGASRVELTGSGDNLDIHSSGASKVELSDYFVNNANVKLSGASIAYLNLDGRLDANLNGASRLIYDGEPSIGSINTSGGSTIREQ